MVTTNRINNNDTCATGDYIDSNMVMAAAWNSLVTHEMMADSEDDARLWNEAWDIAKHNDFGLMS